MKPFRDPSSRFQLLTICRQVGALFLLLAAGILFGCHTCPPPAVAPGPAAVLKQYFSALNSGDIRGAWQLLTSRARERTSEESFRAYLGSRSGASLKDDVKSIGDARETEIDLSAEAEAGHGRRATARMIWEGDSWHLDSGSVLPWTGATPEEALEQFLLAIEAGDCQALTESAPPKIRARLPRDQMVSGCREQLEALQQTAARVRQARDKLEKTSEVQAVLSYQGNEKVLLGKHGDRWFVDDL